MLTACLQQKDKSLSHALDAAGKNRQELEKVLAHYKDDSLKLNAAQFLINNMQYHCYFESKKYDLFKNNLHPIIHEKKLSGEAAFKYLEEKYGRLTNQDFITKNDIQSITSQYLIKNIDFAFNVWRKQPWGKTISFDVFCRDILPYRIDNEALEEWREDYYNYFQPILDSLMTDSSAVSACQIIYDTIEKQDWHFMGDMRTPHVGGKALLNYRFGNCREYSDFALYAMRALGIAGGINIIVQNPNFSFTHHYWNYVRDAEGKIVRFELYNERPGTVNEARMRAKVYESRFDLPKTTLSYLFPDKKIPKVLENRFYSDEISSEYYSGYNINIAVDKNNQRDNILYLCVYNSITWVPVCWAEIKNSNAVFQSVEPNIIFLPAYFIDGMMCPASDPVLLSKDHKLQIFNSDFSQLEEITVTRKSSIHPNLIDIGRLAINGKFQGANNADFKDAVTLYTIKEAPEMVWYEHNTHSSQKFRYVRYLSPEDSTNCNMAEVQFYTSNEEKLTGKIIGNEGHKGQYPDQAKEALFDDNPLTYFQAKEAVGAWSGLDLKQQYSIGKIRYLFRNDDNAIREGDRYELFYYTKENGMISIGQQIGTKEQKLIFKNVPKGVLLWLHNHTRGHEECFFLYKNNKQLFIYRNNVEDWL